MKTYVSLVIVDILFLDHLKGFWLYITRANFTNSSAVAYENTGAYGNGIFVININSSHQQGRYLTIDLPMSVYSHRAIAGPLVLCEVEIFTQGNSPCRPLLAFKMYYLKVVLYLR